MNGNWNFAKESTASPNDLDLKTRPSCIRPETHWAQEVERQGRPDGRLWFSLQLPVDYAEELCDAFAGSDLSGRFGELITGGTLMAPASYAALRLAIAAANPGPARWQGPGPASMDRMLGTDILVSPGAYDALRQLVHAEEAVVELTERASRVGEHVRHVVVDRLHVREELAVVEVAGDPDRLRDVAVERGGAEPERHELLVRRVHLLLGVAAERERHSRAAGRRLPLRVD